MTETDIAEILRLAEDWVEAECAYIRHASLDQGDRDAAKTAFCQALVLAGVGWKAVWG